MRARLASPTRAPASTIHGPGRAASTARMLARIAPAPRTPKTANDSTSGYISRSGPAAIASSAESTAVRRDRHPHQPAR